MLIPHGLRGFHRLLYTLQFVQIPGHLVLLRILSVGLCFCSPSCPCCFYEGSWKIHKPVLAVKIFHNTSSLPYLFNRKIWLPCEDERIRTIEATTIRLTRGECGMKYGSCDGDTEKWSNLGISFGVLITYYIF